MQKGGEAVEDKLENNLKRLRFDKGDISQQELAENIGVSRQTIISIEKGNYVPSTLLALKLAKFFNVKVENIFHLEEKN